VSSEVLTSVRDGVAWLTLKRPAKRNAMTSQMWDTLRSAAVDFGGRDDVRVLAIQGSGGCFTAGADLESIMESDGSLSRGYHDKAFAALAAIREFPFPTLALVDGPCIGAGCSIALSCDVRFASTSAVFAVPGVSLGIVYEEWSVARLVDLMGSGRTSRFLLAAQRLPAPEAEVWGLIERCTDDLTSEGEAYLRTVCSGDRNAIAGTRRIIRRLARSIDRQPPAGA